MLRHVFGGCGPLPSPLVTPPQPSFAGSLQYCCLIANNDSYYLTAAAAAIVPSLICYSTLSVSVSVSLSVRQNMNHLLFTSIPH